MSVVSFKSRSFSRKKLEQAISEGRAQYLCEGNNYEDFYFLDNRIVAKWCENPDSQFDSWPTAGELDLDDFLAEVKRIEKMPAKEKENIARIISENEAAIRQREYDRDLAEAKVSVEASLKSLIYSIKRLEEFGIKSDWIISRDGKQEFETSKEETFGSKV